MRSVAAQGVRHEIQFEILEKWRQLIEAVGDEKDKGKAILSRFSRITSNSSNSMGNNVVFGLS